MRYKYTLELDGCDLVDIETNINLDFEIEKEEIESIWQLIIKSLKDDYGSKDKTYLKYKYFWWQSYYKVKSSKEIDLTLNRFN